MVRSYGLAARSRAQELFSEEAVLPRYISLYEGLMADYDTYNASLALRMLAADCSASLNKSPKKLFRSVLKKDRKAKAD